MNSKEVLPIQNDIKLFKKKSSVSPIDEQSFPKKLFRVQNKKSTEGSLQIDSLKKDIDLLIKVNNDPTKSSPLSQAIHLEKKENHQDQMYDKNTGDTYFKKPESETDYTDKKIEHFVSLISKNILRNSDFVEKDGKYYSKEIKIENTRSGKNMELEAEVFLLKYLFSDSDHSYSSNTDYNHQKNVIMNKKGQFTHYDYGRAMDSGKYGQRFAFTNISEEQLAIDINADMQETMYHLHFNEPGFKIINFFSGKTKTNLVRRILEKAKLFKEQINDKNFFNAVLKKSAIDLNSDKFNFLEGSLEQEKNESLRQYFLERLNVLNKTLR